MCGVRSKLARFIVLNRKNKTRPRLQKQINMDSSPPLFPLILQLVRALGPLGWQLCGSLGVGGTPAAPQCGGWGTLRRRLGSQLPAFAGCAPSSSVFPAGPVFRRVAQRGRLVFGVAGVSSLPVTPTSPFAPSFSLSLPPCLCFCRPCVSGLVQRSCKNAMKVKT